MKIFEITESKEIWYHGSNKRIQEFNLDYISSGTGLNQHGPGIYLTTDPVDARMYGTHLHVVEVNMIKSRLMPLTKRTLQTGILNLINRAPDLEDTLSDWDRNFNRALQNAVASIVNYNPLYRDALEQTWYSFYRYHPKEYLCNLIDIGYIGFVLPTVMEDKHFICWNPYVLKVTQVL